MTAGRVRWRRRALAAGLAVVLLGWLVPASPAAAHPLQVVPADHWTYRTLYRLAAWRLAPLWAASARPLTRMELARTVVWGLERLASERATASTGATRPRSALEDLEALVLEFADELAMLGYRVVDPPMGPSARAMTGWGVWLDRAVVARIEAGEPHWMERAEGSSLRLQVRGALGFGPSLAAGTEILKGLTWGDDPTAGLRRAYLSGETMGMTAQAGRDYLWWGPGWRGAFLLSDNAGPLDALRVSIAWDKVRFAKFVAPIDYQGRFLYGLRYDWLLKDGLRVGFSETVLGSGGLYAPYVFNPIPGINYALSLWDRGRRQGLDDNYSFSVDFDWRIRSGILVYSEIFFDDIAFGNALGFGRPDPNPHRIGGLIGVFVSSPFGASSTDLRFEHSRVRNWVYTTRRNLNDYIRNERSLGHWCAPDCELWSAQFTRRTGECATMRLAYDLVRKGEGRLGQTWSSPEEMWEKLYLWGVIETTHALTLGYSWRRRNALSQTVSLTWSATSNADHVVGQNRQDWFLKWEVRYEF